MSSAKSLLSIRERILWAFREASHKRISGETLARELGTTRANVWKHIQVLKKWGFPIQGSPRNGYCISHAFDFSLLELQFLNQKIQNIRIHYDFIVESTQASAKAGAVQGAPEKSLWISETQANGQGRLQRVWESGIGGLWFSLLLRPRIPPIRIPPLTLVAGLTMAQAIEKQWGLPIRLKWPNDLLLNTSRGWRKVGGILTDISGEMDRTHWVVIGIGINVNNEIPASLEKIAISLNPEGKSLKDRADLLRKWSKDFYSAYEIYQKKGFEAFQKSYWANYSCPNEMITLRTSQGIVRGTSRGVDESGALLVESNNKINPIWEGEIVL